MYRPPGDPRPHGSSETGAGAGTATAAAAAAAAANSYSSASQVTTRFPSMPTPASLLGSMGPPSAFPPSASASPVSNWYTSDQQPRHPSMLLSPLDQGRSSQTTPTMPSHLSPGGRNIITVFGNGFVPQQGAEGTQIVVTCDLNFPLLPGTNGNGNLVRLIIGEKDVDTQVAVPTPQNNYYIVSAEVPPLSEMKGRGSSVPVYIEALTERYGVHEQLSLGDFQFVGGEAGAGGGQKRRASVSLEPPQSQTPRTKPTPARRRSGRHEGYASAMPNSFVYDSPPPSPQPGLVRTTQMHGGAPVSGHNPYVVRTKARLEVEGNLNNMKCGWTAAMWQNRRCLVQFTRRQVGATVHASFKPVEERDWLPNMIVISCLWHEARSECYFTSVDAIYLLECLMATRYTTEEKNRIRRNLESFKPTTLQKNEGQWQDFYAHIMSYPNPKPRNIDKGLKVFPWCHLEQALKKIFGNYSAYITAPFPYSNNSGDGPAQPVTYAHQTHALSDALSYNEDRAAAHHAATSGQPHVGAGSDSLSAYVDMSGANSSSTDARDFSTSVSMSPATTPAYPRDFSVSYPLGGSSSGSDTLSSPYAFGSHVSSYNNHAGARGASYEQQQQQRPSPTTNTQESPYTPAHPYPAP